jgi:predicted RND superfamily exporter protein
MSKHKAVILSPFLVIAVNIAVAYLFGHFIGNWAFIPMILIGWGVWSFFILRFGGMDSIRKWLQ